MMLFCVIRTQWVLQLQRRTVVAGGDAGRGGGWAMKTPVKQILEQALKGFEETLKKEKIKYHYTPNTIDNRVRGARAFVGYLLGEEWRKFIPGKAKRLQVPLFKDARTLRG